MGAALLARLSAGCCGGGAGEGPWKWLEAPIRAIRIYVVENALTCTTYGERHKIYVECKPARHTYKSEERPYR